MALELALPGESHPSRSPVSTPASLMRMGNDFVEDVLLAIILDLSPTCLNALLRTCKRFFVIVAPRLYRSILFHLPSSDYTSTPGGQSQIALLACIASTLHHSSSPTHSWRFLPQYIHSFSYISYDPAADLRCLPLLATILRSTLFLHNFQFEYSQDSHELALDLFRRRQLISNRPRSMLEVLQAPSPPTRVLPRIESVRSTKVAVLAELLGSYPLKTVVLDHAVPGEQLGPLLPPTVAMAHSTVERLSLSLHAHSSLYRLSNLHEVVRAVARVFPSLTHVAFRCPMRNAVELLEVSPRVCCLQSAADGAMT